MKTLQPEKDLPQIIFSLIFILLMIIACFMIIQPFILGFVWAGMVVIATWPLMLKLQELLWGYRSLAIIIMMLLFLLLFFIPIAILVNSLINNIGSMFTWDILSKLHPPQLSWLQEIPLVGLKLYTSYHLLVDDGGSMLIAKLHPYVGRTTGFFMEQAGHFGRFLLLLGLILLFSALLFWNGEQIGNNICRFAFRLASHRGYTIVLLAKQAIRSVAIGVIVTALIQSILGGIGLAIANIPYATLLTIIMILFCLLQIGPLLVLVPSVIWLYWNNDTTWGTFLLIWTGMVGTLDNVLRPVIIHMGVDLPVTLVLSGAIGGLFAFGMIGLFIGPVILSVSYRLLSEWMDGTLSLNKDSKNKIEELVEHSDIINHS